MLVGLPCGLARSQQHRVLATGVEKCKLIECEALSARLGDASTGLVCESQGSDLQVLEGCVP